MAQFVKESVPEPGICWIRLNRPDRRNALNVVMLAELCEIVERLEGASASSDRLKDCVRVIILSGEGSVFCSGLDLVEGSDPEMVQRSAEMVARTLSRLRSTRMITIAAVHGGAFAGGAGLMAACDVAVGTNDLQIAFPEARRGLLPALVCGFLSTKIRDGDLRELFLLGNSIDAWRAQQIGLLQRVVETDRLEATALEMARAVLAGGPQTVADTKRLLNEAYQPQVSISMERMLQSHRDARQSSEAIEGLKAFLEKRSPNWLVR